MASTKRGSGASAETLLLTPEPCAHPVQKCGPKRATFFISNLSDQ